MPGLELAVEYIQSYRSTWEMVLTAAWKERLVRDLNVLLSITPPHPLGTGRFTLFWLFFLALPDA